MELIPIITKALVFTIGLFLIVVVISYFVSTIKRKGKSTDFEKQREELRKDLNAFYQSQYYKSRQQDTQAAPQIVPATPPVQKKIIVEPSATSRSMSTRKPEKKYIAQPRYAVLNNGSATADPYMPQHYKKHYRDEIGWNES